jgi:hypothetical protein
MGKVHDLVRVHGSQKALELAASARDRRLTRIASDILAEERQALSITYSGFCLTALPHKRLPNDQIWERATRNISLLVEPVRVHGHGVSRYLGVPYGSRARLILLYLQTEAVRRGTREIELGRSMRDWLQRMGIGVGGKSYKDVREQAARIGACRLTFRWHADDGRSRAWEHDHIIKGGFAFHEIDSDGRQDTLWSETVRLGETFYEELRRHPVPIFEPAIRHIANQSLTIDIYIWLAYRLHSLARMTPVSWISLKEQFGPGYASVKAFRQRFIQAFDVAQTVYPQARVNVESKGLVLYPSPPPIERRSLVAVSGAHGSGPP